ncbi:hypothetical protein FACS189429_7360 [Bacteroidia bacterium]|nr:hypothetical protein FACS189429_7360 [Bacteroidia bacterium]
MLFVGKNQIYGQTDNKPDSALLNALQGRICDIVAIELFPLINDVELKNNKRLVIYPLLVVNGVQIKGEKMVNCFRNHFDRTKIKKIKHITKEQAERKGIPNVPKDGVLFVTTKKDYYFDFSCSPQVVTKK